MTQRWIAFGRERKRQWVAAVQPLRPHTAGTDLPVEALGGTPLKQLAGELVWRDGVYTPIGPLACLVINTPLVQVELATTVVPDQWHGARLQLRVG